MKNYGRCAEQSLFVNLFSKNLLITRSGVDKSEMAVDNLMVCGLDGTSANPSLKPSAETALHTRLYALDNPEGAVLHTHSVASTVVSRAASGGITVHGFEMQKAIDRVTSHDEQLVIPVLENNPDIPRLDESVWARGIYPLKIHGYLAVGKPVVRADVPSVREFSGIVAFAQDDDDWQYLLERAIVDDDWKSRGRETASCEGERLGVQGKICATRYREHAVRRRSERIVVFSNCVLRDRRYSRCG